MSFPRSFPDWTHQTLDALSDIFFVLGREHRLLLWNEQFTAITGYSDAEVTSMRVFDFFVASEHARIREAIEHAFRGDPFSVVTPIVTKAGREIPFEFAGSVLTEDDAVIGICSLGRNVSEHLHAEQSLAETKKWLHTIFQHAGMGIVVLEAPEWEFVLANPAFQEWMGLSADQLRERTLEDVVHPDDRATVREACRSAREQMSEVQRIETRYQARDGGVLWGRTTLSAIEHANGRTFLIGTFEDLSTIRRYRRQRDQGRNRWRQLVENHPDAVLIIERENDRVVFANEAAARVFGAGEPADMLDRSMLDFVPDSGRSAFRQHLHRDGASGDPPLEHRIVGLDGRERTVTTRSAAVVYQGTHAFQAVIRAATPQTRRTHLHDTHDERQAPIEDEPSAVLVHLSHNIRTPLTAILDSADLLIDAVDASARPMVQQIATSGRQLLDTLNSTLDLIRLEHGAIDLNDQAVDVAALLRTVVASYQPDAERKNLHIDLVIGCDEPVEIETDEDALTRIVRHLIANAVKFTDEGYVTVTLVREDASLALQVEDTGIGIDEAFLPYIFDGFKQEARASRRDDEGMGLGLAITKRLVDQMGGSIDVKSQKSIGSTFTVRLPHTSETSSQPEPAPPDRSTNRPRLLVLEDNAITLRLLDRILQDHYRVNTAASVDEALARVGEKTYDGFVFDIDLSGRRTGIEALHEIRSQSNHRTTPAIACTAPGLRAYKPAFLEAGFDAVLPKPVTKPSLLDALDEVLASPHRPRRSIPFETTMEIDLPPLPTTVPEIARLIAREDDTFDLEELTTILERDQIASMWLLGHINSAYYDLHAEVTSIDRAVVYAGFRPVCNLVLTEILNKTFSNLETDAAQAVYHHIMRTSLAAASFAKTLSTILDIDRPEVTYSAALLCQIGRLLLLDEHGSAYAELWYDEDDPDTFIGPPPIGRELLTCGTNYIQFGTHTLRASTVSQDILSLILHHRDPEHVPTNELKDPVLAIAAGFDVADALFDPRTTDGSHLQTALLQSTALQTLGQRFGRSRDELAYVLLQDVDRVTAFIDRILGQDGDVLSSP